MTFSFLEFFFSVFRVIFMYLYDTNEKIDDVIGGFTKTVQQSITNISRIIEGVFLKLGTRTVHHKTSKMTSGYN